MKTKPFAILLMILCTIFTSFAQVFYKKGAPALSFNIISLITNYPIIFGFILYGLGAIIMIYAFKHGEVTILYPIITLGYIWVSLLSVYFFNEIMNPYKWLGVIIIILGVYIVGLGGKKSETSQYVGVVE